MVKTTDYVGTLFDDASNPNKITVAYTMAAKAAEKGHSATVILMVDAVHLAKPDALKGMDIGAPFKPAGEMLEAFIKHGGQVLVCEACMVYNGIDKSEIDPRFGLIGADDVIDLVMSAKGSLQLT